MQRRIVNFSGPIVELEPRVASPLRTYAPCGVEDKAAGGNPIPTPVMFDCFGSKALTIIGKTR